MNDDFFKYDGRTLHFSKLMLFSLTESVHGSNERTMELLAVTLEMEPLMSKNGVVRRNIELQLPSVERLDKLKGKLEATSDSEVLRRALKILEQLVEEEENGRRLLIREPNGDVVAFRLL